MSQTDSAPEFSALDGKLKCQYYDNSGAAVGEAVGYYDNGTSRFKYPLVKGALSGTGKTWYEDGMLHGEESFRNGVLHGRRREWYPGGILRLETNYEFGHRSGEHKEWYEDGKPKKRCEYSAYTANMSPGSLHGAYLEWYPDGKLKVSATYKVDRIHGVCKVWNEVGVMEKRVYVRGVRVSGDLGRVINSGKLTAKHILRVTNAAVRRVCLEELGYGRFLSQLPHAIIDRSGEYELVKIDWHKREEPIYLVKVKCPSTGAFYTLRVPTDMKTVKEAVAWTFGVSQNEYLPEIET
jgi:antitoxin component YwqK of YwqJK toxin-antitoxin module